MQTLSASTATFSARKSAMALGGLLAATAAAAVGAVLALVFTATIVVIAVMSSILFALAGLAFKARRSMKPVPVRSSDDDVIEARRVGGHSWVAYGWDRR